MPSLPSSKPSDRCIGQFLLTGCEVMALSGPDASGFAQAQFANDVSQLEAGRWHWNAWLSPKGRVIALFRLLRLDANHLLAVLIDTPAQPLIERLALFRFRSKLELSQPAWRAHGIVQGPGNGFEPTVTTSIDHGIRVRLDAERELLLQPGVSSPDLAEELEPNEAWRLADIRAGIVHLDPADVEAFTAHMLGLDALAAFSLKKGCFPGHEILARSHYLGRVKRGLRRVLSDGRMPRRGEILQGDHAIGHLLCSARAGQNGSEGLAVLPLDVGIGPLQIGADGPFITLA